MSVVGRAYVTVRAVTKQVPGDIQGGVDRALSRLDVSGGEAAGQKLGTQVAEGIDKGITNSDVGTSITDAMESGDSEGAGERIGDRAGRGVKKGFSGHTTKAWDDEQRAIRLKADSDGSIAGAMLGDAIGKGLLRGNPIRDALRKSIPDNDREIEFKGYTVGRAIGVQVAAGMVQGAPGVLLSSMILPLAQQGIPALAEVGAAATALATTLGPTLAAGAGAGVSAVGGLITTVGTLTLAFKTNKDSVAELVAGLGPARDAWSETGAVIQNRLFPALEGAGNRLTAALGPELRSGMLKTADAVAGTVGQLTRLAETASFQERLGRMLDNNAVSMSNFGSAAISSVDALASIAAAASPLTVRFSSWVDKMAEGAAETLRAKEATGELDDFFSRAGDTAAEWGSILGNVGRALGNVLSAGTSEGGQLLDMLDHVTQRFENWTNSLEGQQMIGDWFATAIPIVNSLQGVIAGLTEGLGNFIGTGERTRETLGSISDILPNVGTFLGALSTNVGGLLGVLEPVSDALARIAPQFSETGTALWDELGGAVDKVLPSLESIVDSALQLADALSPIVGVLGVVAQITGVVLAPALKGVATILDALPDSVVGVVGALVVLKLGFASLIASERFAPLAASFSASMATVRTEAALTGASMGRLRAATTVATSAMGGGIGVALAAAVIGLGVFASKNAEAEARVDALTSTLDAQTGAITENTRASVANSLEKSGALEDAQKLGLSLATVTDAALGQEDAIKAVNTTLAKYVDFNDGSLVGGWDDMPGVVKTLFTMTGAVDDNQEAAIGLHGALNTVSNDLDSAKSGFERTSEAVNGAKVHVHDFSREYAGADAIVDRFTRGQRDASGSLVTTTGAQKALTSATLAYQSAVSKSIGGTIGLEQAIDDAAKAMNANRHTLNLNTQAGRDNMTALKAIADAAGQVTGSADKQQAALERARNKIIAYGDGMGLSTDKAEALADRLIKVKDDADKIPGKYTAEVDAKTDSAQTALSGLRTTLNALTDHPWSFFVSGTVKTTHQTVYTGGGGSEAPDPALANRSFGGVGPSGAGGGARGIGATVLGRVSMPAGTSSGSKSSSAPAGGVVINHNEQFHYALTVNNPTAERTSDSLPRALRRSRDLGITSGKDGK